MLQHGDSPGDWASRGTQAEEHCTTLLQYTLPALCPGAGTLGMVFWGWCCQQSGFGSIWSAKPYGGGAELTGPCFFPSLGGFVGSGFGFSSSVMVFILLSLVQSREQGRQPVPLGQGSPTCCRSLHGLTCWGSPLANTRALLGEEKQPSRSACSERVCFEHSPVTPSLGISWNGDPRGDTVSLPCPAHPQKPLSWPSCISHQKKGFVSSSWS